MSQVKILDRGEAVMMLFNAMCKQAGPKVIETFKLDTKGNDTVADVVVTVNGVEVDLMGYFTDYVNDVYERLDDVVKERAEQLWSDLATPFTDAGYELHRLAEEIQGLNWKVRQVLGKLEG